MCGEEFFSSSSFHQPPKVILKHGVELEEEQEELAEHQPLEQEDLNFERWKRRPIPKRTLHQKIADLKKYLWNAETNEFMGRSGKSWSELTSCRRFCVLLQKFFSVFTCLRDEKLHTNSRGCMGFECCHKAKLRVGNVPAVHSLCVLMLDVYIGAWMIQRVPTKTDCLGTRPQQEDTVLGLALARNQIPLNLTMLSAVLFPKPWRPRC